MLSKFFLALTLKMLFLGGDKKGIKHKRKKDKFLAICIPSFKKKKKTTKSVLFLFHYGMEYL